MILMLDNYDSFTYNLVQELMEIGPTPVEVVRNDVASAVELLARRPEAIVVSPGPGTPEAAGMTIELVEAAAEIPLLGICLGHQALAVAHGARIVRAPVPVHGKTSQVHHSGCGVFAGLPSPLVATRYHSLVVERESVPPELEVRASTEDGLVMALAHRSRPHHGVQFHPESYMTTDGRRLLAAFLGLAGLPVHERWAGGATAAEGGR